MGNSDYGVGMREIDRRCRALGEALGRPEPPVTIRWVCPVCGSDHSRADCPDAYERPGEAD